MKISLNTLSPPVLIIICWTMTFAIAGYALARPDRFDLVAYFLSRENIDLAAFTRMGTLWIALCFLVYLVADFAFKSTLPAPRPMRISINVNRAASLCFWANVLFLGITVLWILVSARHVGGVMNLAALVYADSLAARDLLLQNKLFTGMRLFYAVLPATGALAATLLATPQDAGLARRYRRMCLATVIVNLIALLVLPIVMSQRLLLLQFILSAYIGACLVRGRIVGLAYLPLGLALFLATWILREAVTNPMLDRSAFDLGMQKLAFYFVNDLWNSYSPLATEISHTFGMFSLRGLLFFTFTDGFFATFLADRLAAIEDVRGGGDFSIFTAPYVDFGPFIGAAFVACFAVAFRYAFHMGRQTLTGAVIYGQLGASLLFSTHGVYFTHHNFFFSVMVLAFIGYRARLARTRPGRGARQYA